MAVSEMKLFISVCVLERKSRETEFSVGEVVQSTLCCSPLLTTESQTFQNDVERVTHCHRRQT